MAKVLVVYESRYGQASKIAEHVADIARERGHDVHKLHASFARARRVAGADGIIVVAPVYFGRHSAPILAFLRDYADVLAVTPCAFVSVGNEAASASWDAREVATMRAHHAVDALEIRPCAVVAVGGALAYPRYGFFARQLVRILARHLGEPTDTSRTHELTDWNLLDGGIAPFFDAIEPTPAQVLHWTHRLHPAHGSLHGEA